MKSLIASIAKKLPYSIQSALETACCKILQKLKTKYVIKFRGFFVEMPTTDTAASQIYFRYLLTGLWFHESYEQFLVEKILSHLREVYFIDAGASYGLYTLIAAALPSVKTVIAVESSPNTYEYLKATISSNNLTEKITVKNAAVACKSGLVYQVANHRNSEWNRAIRAMLHDGSDVIESVSIDDLIPYAKFTSESTIFIKMDIEGCEPDAFDGMPRLFASKLNFLILFEFHVGVLDERQNGANAFARKIMALPYDALLQVDSKNKKLIPIRSSSEFDELIAVGRTAPFPENVFNLLLIKGPISSAVGGWLSQGIR